MDIIWLGAGLTFFLGSAGFVYLLERLRTEE